MQGLELEDATMRCMLLVVDDEVSQRSIIIDAAMGIGIVEIVQASTESEASLAMRDTTFQLAVVDIMLSSSMQRDGLRVIRELRDLQPDCRIIALTSKGGTEIGVECLEAGAHDFVSTNWQYINWVTLLEQRLSLWRGVLAESQTLATVGIGPAD